MNRRSFIKGMLAAGVASMWLPGAGRVWRPVMAETVVAPAAGCGLVIHYSIQDLIAAVYALKRQREQSEIQEGHLLNLHIHESPYFGTTQSIYEALRKSKFEIDPRKFPTETEIREIYEHPTLPPPAKARHILP